MEHFDENPGKIKEKNVYFLQLNPPRIILIASAVLGVVLVSFLLGMNYMNKDNTGSELTGENLVFDENKSLELLNRNVPTPPHNGDITKDDIAKPFEEKVPGIDENEKAGKNELALLNSNDPKESVDVLTNEDIKEIIPSSKNEEKKTPKKIKKKAKTPKKNIAKRHEKKTRKTTVKKKKRRSRVVEVASSRKNNANRRHSGYAVQVASFDRKTKARSEISRLKSMRYDAYMDSTRVNGTKFYRVRVGPISSKRKAISMLNDLQNKPRYSGSYMIKE